MQQDLTGLSGMHYSGTEELQHLGDKDSYGEGISQ